MYFCANCGGEITVADNFIGGGLITVNVNGHAKAAHRECPCTHSAWIHIGSERYCASCGIDRDELEA